MLAVRDQTFHRLDQLSLGHTEVVGQKFRVLCAGEMFEALEIGLPIAGVLVVKAVNDVFAQDQVRELHLGLAAEQARRNQVCLMNRATLITRRVAARTSWRNHARCVLSCGSIPADSRRPSQEAFTSHKLAELPLLHFCSVFPVAAPTAAKGHPEETTP
jgi:hypothetical protein